MENSKKAKKAVNEVSLVDLSLIDKSTFNPRKKFDETALDELSESIKQQGLLQPIKIRPITGTNRYEIVFGERRYRAALIAGLKKIPAMISVMSDDEAEDAAIVENLHRKDVAPLEEAEAYARLIEKGKDDINSLAVKFGKNKVYIKGRLQLLNLISDFRDLLDTEDINLGVAGVLANYEKELQQDIFDNHFGRNCAPYALWSDYRASKLQKSINDLYSTRLENCSFDKTECESCQFNTATFSLFVGEDCTGKCLKKECLRKKQVAYIVESSIKLQQEKPELQMCYDSIWATSHEAIEQLIEKGFDIQTVNLLDSYLDAEPEMPNKDDFETEEEYEDAQSGYEEELADYQSELLERDERLSKGEIKAYIQITDKCARIAYAEVDETVEGTGEDNMQGETEEGFSDGVEIKHNPEVEKLQKKITRNNELCSEKIVERQKELIKKMDIPSCTILDVEVALMYSFMAKSMDVKSYGKLELGKEVYRTDYVDFLELTEEKKNIIVRGFIASHLKEIYIGGIKAQENSPLRAFLNLHEAEEVANIDIELKSVYKNRNNRLQERIEAMNERD